MRKPTKTLVYDIRCLLQSAGNEPEMMDSYIKLIEDTVNAETGATTAATLG